MYDGWIIQLGMQNLWRGPQKKNPNCGKVWQTDVINSQQN